MGRPLLSDFDLPTDELTVEHEEHEPSWHLVPQAMPPPASAPQAELASYDFGTAGSGATGAAPTAMSAEHKLLTAQVEAFHTNSQLPKQSQVC